MNARRTLATVAAAAVLSFAGAGAAHAAPTTVKTTTTTVTTVTTVKTVTTATKNLGSSQVKKNAAAVLVADKKCGKWSATATKKVLDCRWTTLKANGYVAPKVDPKVYDAGADGPDPGTSEWTKAYGKALAPDAPPAGDVYAANGPVKPAKKK